MKRMIKLVLGSLAIAVVWLWLLPLIAQNPVVERHMRLLDERNINAGAMFYTEVEENR